MNKKKERQKKKQRQLRLEMRRQARLAQGGKIARWKIILPIIIVLFLLHCRVWHLEEEWLMKTAFTTTVYQEMYRNIAVILTLLGICGWMVYACTHRKEEGKDKKKWILWNMLYGFFTGVALTAFCTNVITTFLFWLNSSAIFEIKIYEYKVVGTALHDREHKSYLGRYSAAWLINNFNYGELFIKGDKYTRMHVSYQLARQFSGAKGLSLKMELADGCLGWGVIRKIDPVATAYPQSKEEAVYIDHGTGESKGDSCLQRKKEYNYLYTWEDIQIFARIRSIKLKDTAHVSVSRYIDSVRDIPVWKIDIRDSVQLDKVRAILVHGESGEVLEDSYK